MNEGKRFTHIPRASIQRSLPSSFKRVEQLQVGRIRPAFGKIAVLSTGKNAIPLKGARNPLNHEICLQFTKTSMSMVGQTSWNFRVVPLGIGAIRFYFHETDERSTW